jgi:hypothetical protein
MRRIESLRFIPIYGATRGQWIEKLHLRRLSQKKGAWLRHEIEWLFSQELPLFVCITDREKGRFRLYSTSAMWLVRYQMGNEMALIELCADATHDPLKESLCQEKIGPIENGGGNALLVPLGNPVVDVTIPTLDDEIRKRAIRSLRIAIEVEQMNLTLRRLGVHIASWLRNIIPNDPSSLRDHGGSIF